jgi:hypothetical protein
MYHLAAPINKDIYNHFGASIQTRKNFLCETGMIIGLKLVSMFNVVALIITWHNNEKKDYFAALPIIQETGDEPMPFLAAIACTIVMAIHGLISLWAGYRPSKVTLTSALLSTVTMNIAYVYSMIITFKYVDINSVNVTPTSSRPISFLKH